jgi:L-rhamnonate dehydratase
VGSSEIVEVEALAFRSERRPAEFDPAAETLVVRLVDAAGRSGIGEADGPAEVLRQLVLMKDTHSWSRGLRSMLIGRDPLEIRAINAELYRGTLVHGRRGLGVHALSAVDVALHDLAGKQVGKPVYSLLGGPFRDRLRPYATIYPGLPGGRPLSVLLEDIETRVARAIELGYTAVKIEVIFEDCATDREIASCIQHVRGLVGPDVALMVDFGYRWSDWREALWTLSHVEDCDLYFAEAVLRHDDIAGHAKLASRVRTRICGAELAATIHECREWIEHGHVDVLQPELSRCGGLSELRRIADLADLHGVLVIPHNWKTGINAAATRHLHAATPNVPLIEWLDPELWDAPLRRDLATPEPVLTKGTFPLPAEPGLGVSLDDNSASRYEVISEGGSRA